jgi:hypothetical protein
LAELVTAQTETAHLKRALGRWDLVALFVVAVFNLNVVPSIAANGGVTVWLWIISLVLFFWPQGIAVIELAHRYPGEGGVYLWAKEVFGEFHGFLSGWCYWTNNMMYVPTVMLYFVGVSVFVFPSHQYLADNKVFAVSASLGLLAILVVLNIVGLGVGKWINNLGSIGTVIAAAVLVGLGLIVWLRYGTTVSAEDFRIPANPRFLLNSFGVICFGLVGLELASVMGDEIKDPERTLPGAVVWGGIISGILYIATTLTLLVAVSKNDINVLQGIVQAVSHMAQKVGVLWNWFCMAGWFGAHSVCRGPRFVSTELARQSSSALRHSVRCVDRSFCCFYDFSVDQFSGVRRSGNFSTAVVARGGAAAASVSVYVCGAVENCGRSLGDERPLQQDGAVAVGIERIVDDDSRNDLRVFTSAANQFGLVVRGVDVWRDSSFHRTRGILFLCIWAQENRRPGSGPSLIII